ncbi:LWR-salt protein [Haloarchaeobius sp. HME9146]|uniref:LWR-salt protein n=1 Tax=Haloarchaeobius sp. HME9146 TaxID=2978732 RepID=UPI0021C1DD2A|nr:LWR-salt protein [Haloarchaeobius sp. HME9146]MCT9097655.1 LWR-salt protein [Haloarchaeobius sp. HME9146]
MHAEYVVAVRFRLDPTSADVSVTPNEFETTLLREADEPGTDGWLFFRDNLWRGELNDPAYVRELAEDELGVTVLFVEFRGLRTDDEYFSALKEAIGENLDLFRADSVHEVLNKYLGSSIQVED